MDIDELLLNIEYLNRGLVPIDSSFYGGRDGDKLKQKLSSISINDAKQAKRRFRKVFRQAVKDKIKKIKYEIKLKRKTKSFKRETYEQWSIESFKNSVGINHAVNKRIIRSSMRAKSVP